MSHKSERSLIRIIRISGHERDTSRAPSRLHWRCARCRHSRNRTSTRKVKLFISFEDRIVANFGAMLIYNITVRVLNFVFSCHATATDIIEGFSIAGLLGTLDPVMFGDFLSNYNRLYPTGLGPSLADTLTSMISYVETMSIPTTAFKKQQSEAFRSTTQEQELYGLLTKVISTPQGPQLLASSIDKHPQKAKLLALLTKTTSTSGSTTTTSKR